MSTNTVWVFKRMHKKKDGSFVDKRSNDIDSYHGRVIGINNILFPMFLLLP